MSGVPVDLTNASICMQFKLRPHAEPALELSLDNGGITMVNALSGEIQVPGRIIDLTPNTYQYDLQYTIPSIGPYFVKSPLGGKLPVTQDITIC